MKVNYKDNTNVRPLGGICYGSLFRLANSQELFIKTTIDGTDDLLNECDSRLINYYENPQDNEWDRPSDIELCINIENGEAVLFHKEVRVVELNASVEVEE